MSDPPESTAQGRLPPQRLFWQDVRSHPRNDIYETRGSKRGTNPSRSCSPYPAVSDQTFLKAFEIEIEVEIEFEIEIEMEFEIEIETEIEIEIEIEIDIEI